MNAPTARPGQAFPNATLPADSLAMQLGLAAMLHGHPPRVCDLIAAGHALREGHPVDHGWLAAQLWDLADLLLAGGDRDH